MGNRWRATKKRPFSEQKLGSAQAGSARISARVGARVIFSLFLFSFNLLLLFLLKGIQGGTFLFLFLFFLLSLFSLLSPRIGAILGGILGVLGRFEKLGKNHSLNQPKKGAKNGRKIRVLFHSKMGFGFGAPIN